MKTIILDTNFLMIPELFKVDIFEELKRTCHYNYKIAVLKQSITELKKLEQTGKAKDRRAARIGFTLIKSKHLKILNEKDGYADDILVRLAQKGKIIATQDIGLKRRLKAIKAPYITLRQKKYLKCFT